MKKYLLAVSVLGIVGAGLSVSAKVDLSVLPSEARKKVEDAIKAGVAQQNPVQAYVEQSKENSEKYQSLASAFIEKHPYLKDDDSAKAYVSAIGGLAGDIQTHEDAVSKAIPDATQVQGDLNGMDSLYKLLEDQAFPYHCETYAGGTVTGYIEKKSGHKSKYALYDSKNVETKPIAEFLEVDNYYVVGVKGKEGEFNFGSAVGKYAEFMVMGSGKDEKAVCFVGIVKPPSNK